MSLLDEFRQFLLSTKLAEGVSPALAESISVRTGLEDVLKGALEAGRRVLVVGEAGGGKTHLLRRATAGVAALRVWPAAVGPGEVRLVPDLTAVPVAARAALFETATAGVAVAANEGPLLELARRERESPYAHGMTLLRQMQSGLPPSPDPTAPVVIDVGGLDLLTLRVPTTLLRLEVVTNLVAACACGLEQDNCARQMAWRQLGVPAVRQRLDEVLSLLSLRGDSVPFREIWDFVADLVLGGECAGDVPTSPWFWRVLNGPSTMSERLKQLADANLAVLAEVEPHLWYGNWDAVENQLIPDAELLQPNVRAPFTTHQFRWLREQAFFLVPMASAGAMLRSPSDITLARALSSAAVADIVADLNEYMTYGLLRGQKAHLDLWLDMGVERRTDLPRGQFSFAAIPSKDLAVVQSRIVGNYEAGAPVLGRNFYLVHERSGASLLLTANLLTLIRSGRSFRNSNRAHADLKWDLARYFYKMLSEETSKSVIDVLKVDYATMRGDRRRYSIEPAQATIDAQEIGS